MQVRLSFPLICGSLLLLCLNFAASAAVNLSITDNDATPTATSVAAGGQFPISIKLFSSSASTSDGVIGVDYFLQASASGLFTLVSRNSTTVSTAFPLVSSSDAAVGNSLLSPQNSLDLGGNVSDITAPVGNGTFEVANFVIGVAAGTPNGLYTISVNDNGAGFADANFLPGTFGSLGSFNVTVTPEPSALLLLAGAGIPLFAARRRI